MSDNDIVKMLRKIEGTSLPISVWKHHVLRAAREIEQSRIDLQEYCRDVVALTAERDRLKDEVGRLRNKTTGTHGTPELDEDARKLEAMGQDPGATFATDPAPVCEWTRTPWGRSPSASPLDALYIPRCDADYLCNVPGSGMCHRCGKPIGFTEAKK